MSFVSTRDTYDATARICRTATEADFDALFATHSSLSRGLTTHAVIKATSKATGRAYAVKTFDKSKPNASIVAILNEVDTLVLLKDAPNITRFVEAYESKEHLYVVMDLYGSDLLEQVSNAQFFSEQDGKKIIQSLANAIKYLHGRKIVHADVRPEKVLCGSDFDKNKNDVYLCDFGKSKIIVDGQPLPKLTGAPSYMSPEIIESDHYSFAADIWALGVTAYVVFGGYKPFEQVKPSDPSLNQQILSGKVEFHDEEWQHVGPVARELILAMLTVDSEKRITAEQVVEHEFFTGTKSARATIQEAANETTNEQINGASKGNSSEPLKKLVEPKDKSKETPKEEPKADVRKEEAGKEGPKKSEQRRSKEIKSVKSSTAQVKISVESMAVQNDSREETGYKQSARKSARSSRKSSHKRLGSSGSKHGDTASVQSPNAAPTNGPPKGLEAPSKSMPVIPMVNQPSSEKTKSKSHLRTKSGDRSKEKHKRTNSSSKHVDKVEKEENEGKNEGAKGDEGENRRRLSKRSDTFRKIGKTVSGLYDMISPRSRSNSMRGKKMEEEIAKAKTPPSSPSKSKPSLPHSCKSSPTSSKKATPRSTPRSRSPRGKHSRQSSTAAPPVVFTEADEISPLRETSPAAPHRRKSRHKGRERRASMMLEERVKKRRESLSTSRFDMTVSEMSASESSTGARWKSKLEKKRKHHRKSRVSSVAASSTAKSQIEDRQKPLSDSQDDFDENFRKFLHFDMGKVVLAMATFEELLSKSSEQIVSVERQIRELRSDVDRLFPVDLADKV